MRMRDLVVAGRVESDRHVFGLVLVDKLEAPEQDSLGNKGGIARPEDTYVIGRVGERLLRLQDRVQNDSLDAGSSSSKVYGHFKQWSLFPIAAERRVMGMGAVLDQLRLLQQNRQYVVSCREGIGRNLSSAYNTSTNRRQNTRLW